MVSTDALCGCATGLLGLAAAALLLLCLAMRAHAGPASLRAHHAQQKDARSCALAEYARGMREYARGMREYARGMREYALGMKSLAGRETSTSNKAVPDEAGPDATRPDATRPDATRSDAAAAGKTGGEKTGGEKAGVVNEYSYAGECSTETTVQCVNGKRYTTVIKTKDGKETVTRFVDGVLVSPPANGAGVAAN